MATFNGEEEDLKFTCNECGTKTVQIDLGNDADKERLWTWLDRHSAHGGKYENVPVTKEQMFLRIKNKAQELHTLLVAKKPEELDTTTIHTTVSKLNTLLDAFDSMK